MAGPGERGCVDCGVSIEGSHGHTRRCGPCSREERKRIDARSLAKRREARRRCACGASLDERHHLARTCLACRSAAERARVERGRRRPAEASA